MTEDTTTYTNASTASGKGFYTGTPAPQPTGDTADMPTDGDTVVASTCSLDANGNVIFPYSAVSAGGTDNVILTHATSGTQFIAPFSSFVTSPPAIGASPGSAVLTDAWGRTNAII